MIAQREISRISNNLARDDGLRVPEAVIERDYCLAWFLTGLPMSRLLSLGAKPTQILDHFRGADK